MKRLLFALLLPITGICQDNAIPQKANLIVVHGVTFQEVCNRLLDSGYVIEKKDAELQTAKTEPKVYPKSWNAAYKIYVRVKDSTAYFNATYTAPWNQVGLGPLGDPLWKDDPAQHHANKKGKTYPKSLMGMPFMWMNSIATSFGKQVEYKIQ